MKKWKVKWDSGGCGSDVWGYIEADTEEEAQQIMEAKYFNGDPYNDDNLFLIEDKRIGRNMSTPENKEFWNSVEESAKRVSSCPDWKKAGVNVEQPKTEQEPIYRTIEFPNEQAAKKYDEEMKKAGFETITVGPTISINEVKRRRFNE